MTSFVKVLEVYCPQQLKQFFIRKQSTTKGSVSQETAYDVDEEMKHGDLVSHRLIKVQFSSQNNNESVFVFWLFLPFFLHRVRTTSPSISIVSLTLSLVLVKLAEVKPVFGNLVYTLYDASLFKVTVNEKAAFRLFSYRWCCLFKVPGLQFTRWTTKQSLTLHLSVT